jgi:hypothetical protein
MTYQGIFKQTEFGDFITGGDKTKEAEAFSTKKVRSMQGHRTNFLRKKKSGLLRRMPRPNAKSELNSPRLGDETGSFGRFFSVWGVGSSWRDDFFSAGLRAKHWFPVRAQRDTLRTLAAGLHPR